MPQDITELEHMRDLGINYVIDTVTNCGVDEGIKLMRSFAFGMCSSLGVISGDKATAEFLYLMADHFAVHGMSAEQFESIGNKIKESATRGGRANHA